MRRVRPALLPMATPVAHIDGPVRTLRIGWLPVFATSACGSSPAILRSRHSASHLRRGQQPHKQVCHGCSRRGRPRPQVSLRRPRATTTLPSRSATAPPPKRDSAATIPPPRSVPATRPPRLMEQQQAMVLGTDSLARASGGKQTATAIGRSVQVTRVAEGCGATA